MGCDIHPVIEIDRYGNGFELAILEPGLPHNRDYFSFSILADERNGEEGQQGWVRPISAPRGLPTDADEITASIFEDLDYHSTSWLTLREMDEYEIPVMHSRRPAGELPTIIKLRDEMHRIYNFMCAEHHDGTLDKDRVRLVFAFDN